jgi:hypothetical protein
MKIIFLDDIPQRWHTFAAVALVKKNGPDYLGG